jgi:signal transduction histidine kinase
VRDGTVTTAALGVAGAPRAFAADLLDPWAPCAALALAPAARTLSVSASAAEVDLAERLVQVAEAADTNTVLRRALEVAEACFSVRSGFACLLTGSSAEVAYYSGFTRERLAEAARHPRFADLVSTPVMQILPPTDGVVARLTEGAEFAICLPLGQTIGVEAMTIVLLVAEPPGRDRSRALEVFRRQVAAGVRSAALTHALDRSGAEVSGVVHAVVDPVLAVDGMGRFLAFNSAAGELFALAEPFEVGRSARGRLGHPELEALLLGERSADFEVALGRPTPTRWLAFSRRIGAGRVLVLRESTRGRRGESEEAQFVAGIGRELRKPVGKLRALLEDQSSVDRAWDDRAQNGRAQEGRAGAAELAAAVGREIEHREAFADQLAFLGDAEGMALRPEHLAVVTLVRGLAAGAERDRPGRAVSVVARPHRVEALVDRRGLERALAPLLDNALRYSDGPVAVEVADRGDVFEVGVVDVGPGIFSGDVPGLFERFHPLDGSPTRRGAGLGLYTARRVVEAMDGRIWCDTRLGVGSRFAFRLPYSA